MKITMIVLAGLFVGSVFAQTTTPAPVVPTPISVPSCFPMVNGSHAGPPRHVNGEVGQHIYWFCLDKDSNVEPAGFSCIHGECTWQVLAAAQQAIIAATAKVRVAKEQYVANVKFECGRPEIAETSKRGELCRERVRIYNSMIHSWLGMDK